MISIEGSEIGYRRACFNKPFKTVRVENGYTHAILPKLFDDKQLMRRSWLIWLDYDDALDADKLKDIRSAVEQAPRNSVLVITLPARGRPFGKPADRPERLRQLLGAVVPDDLSREEVVDEVLPKTLLKLVGDFMTSVAAKASRPGGFVRAFELGYRGSTPMITIGGVLPAPGALSAVTATVSDPTWPAIAPEEIATPPLTFKEAAVFQAQLPDSAAFTRGTIQKLGFDLEEAQLESFQRHYRYYPVFAQVST